MHFYRIRGKEMTNDKELIERLAMHAASRYIDGKYSSLGAMIIDVVERIDAERGKEAIGEVSISDWTVALLYRGYPPGTPVFLAPQIPEGMALVPKKFSKGIAKRYLGRELLNMDRVWFSVATRDYEQMIAAAGEKP